MKPMYEYKTTAGQNVLISVQFSDKNSLESLNDFVSLVYCFGDYKDDILRANRWYFLQNTDEYSTLGPFHGAETEKIQFVDFMEPKDAVEEYYNIFPDKHCEFRLSLESTVTVNMENCEYPEDIRINNIMEADNPYLILDTKNNAKDFIEYVKQKMEVVREVTDCPVDLSGISFEIKDVDLTLDTRNIETIYIEPDDTHDYYEDRY